MKSSNILITTSIAICFVMLITYNFSLKASYKTGSYKNRFNDSEFTVTKDVNDLTVNDANLIDMTVETGAKEGLWIREHVKNQIVIKHTGNKMSISLTDEAKKKRVSFHTDDLVLVTNSLNKLTTNGYFDKTKSTPDIYRYGGAVNLIGLKADRLDLEIGNLTGVYLSRLTIGNLNAVVGATSGYATLDVNTSNQIESADFKVPGPGKLTIGNPKITKTNYVIVDSSTVILGGTALNKVQNK